MIAKQICGQTIRQCFAHRNHATNYCQLQNAYKSTIRPFHNQRETNNHNQKHLQLR